jgi:hypothetical protein
LWRRPRPKLGCGAKEKRLVKHRDNFTFVLNTVLKLQGIFWISE